MINKVLFEKLENILEKFNSIIFSKVEEENRKIRDFYIILPSDKSSTPHFHQFGELTAERRFLYIWMWFYLII